MHYLRERTASRPGKKYDYCMAPECQEKNLKSLTMVAIGVNKSAEQYLLLDDQTRDGLASGKFADQRRGSFGTSVPSSEAVPVTSTPTTPAVRPVRTPACSAPSRRPASARPPAPTLLDQVQERLALLYNEQGLRPEEIARKLRLTSYTVTQIILGSRNRGKL